MAVLAGNDRGRSAQRHPDTGALVELAVLSEPPDVLPADESRRDGFGTGHIDLLAAADHRATIGGGKSPGGPGYATKIVRRKGAVLEGCFAGSAAIARAGAREMIGV